MMPQKPVVFQEESEWRRLTVLQPRRLRLVWERHPQIAFGIAICREDLHLAIGPWVVWIEWRREEAGF